MSYNTTTTEIFLKSDEHIAMKFENVVIIGVYFDPESNFDDISCKLNSILEHPQINHDSAILVGGDFNINPEQTELDKCVRS